MKLIIGFAIGIVVTLFYFDPDGTADKIGDAASQGRDIVRELPNQAGQIKEKIGDIRLVN